MDASDLAVLHGQIAALERTRERLEHLLEMPGIDKAERLAIIQRLGAMAETTKEVWKHYPLPPPPIDSRNFCSRGWDEMKREPIRVGAPAIAAFCASAYTVGYYYTPIRHVYAPYTDAQMARREVIFPNVFGATRRVPPAATKTIAFSMFLLVFGGLASTAEVRTVPKRPSLPA